MRSTIGATPARSPSTRTSTANVARDRWSCGSGRSSEACAAARGSRQPLQPHAVYAEVAVVFVFLVSVVRELDHEFSIAGLRRRFELVLLHVVVREQRFL